MTEHDRVIGELLEFKRVVLAEMAEIKADVKSLTELRWRIVGGAAVASVLVSIAFQAWK